MLDAFIKATEYSPSYHKYVKIEKLDKDTLTDSQKGLLEWYEERYEKN